MRVGTLILVKLPMAHGGRQEVPVGIDQEVMARLVSDRQLFTNTLALGLGHKKLLPKRCEFSLKSVKDNKILNKLSEK